LQLKALFPLIEEILNRFTSYVGKESVKNQPFDVKEISAKYTTDVVSSCIFNADAQSFTKEKPEIREMGRKLIDFLGGFAQFQVILLSIFPWINNIYKIKFVTKEVNDFFMNIMEQAVKLRESSNIKREDYLAHLIDLKKKKSLSSLEMASHAVTFFTDGFETSSLAIAYILYEVICLSQVSEESRE
jgi:cytochrome P450